MDLKIMCFIFIVLGFASASTEDGHISWITGQIKVLTDNQQLLMNIITGQEKKIKSMEQLCSTKDGKSTRQIRYTPVAFSFVLTKTGITTSGHHQPIKFDLVYTDTTKGYNNNSGVYSVSRPGLYQLYMSVAVNGFDAVHAGIFKNSESVTLCTCSALSYGTGSCMLIVPLTTADRIWVTNVNGVHVRGSYMTTLNGICLDCTF